ncbi:MAG TPA: carboxypeptidase-like regulatory domain-containing protein [Candidatus Eisenbacteria bacterium]|jgi:hypothetical protein|nr:carboxypeptidase-like regulatory domain-containing protein [Candidatus Eisenbacteria bacterium]
MRSFRLVSLLSGCLALAFALASCGGGAEEIVVPTVYLIAGRVADPTTSPFTALEGVRVWVETAPEVAAVTTDANGDFIIHGVPAGNQRLRAEFPGRVPSLSTGLDVSGNVDNAGLPLFTRAEIDSILAARGLAPWDTTRALFGMFALRSNDVPLGGASIALNPSTGGTLSQTGVGADPILIDNPIPGDYSLTVTQPGFVWDGPFATHLQAGLVTFGTPRARPNINGFVFRERSTGNAVDGAAVAVFQGPTGAQATSDFLGQFSLVGLLKGTYTVRATALGFLPGLSWPQDLQADTTLTFLVVTSDTLAAWAAAGGASTPGPAYGTLLVEARNESGGALLPGATIVTTPPGGIAIPQSARAPALVINLPPGVYTVSMVGGGVSASPSWTNVIVRAGIVTSSRLDLPVTGRSP